MTEPRVGRAAFTFGFAGLLPQVAAVAMVAIGRFGVGDLSFVLALLGYGLALTYGAIILSFLGGIWWGFAMRRQAGQGTLAALAVLPSLAALGFVASGSANLHGSGRWSAVALGSAVMLTLLVDRRLVATGEAPANWMRLRVPLSLGLGLLTIAAGALAGA